jgi:hypothetical protein
MKNDYIMTLLLTLFITTLINAYEFSFHNNTENPTAIAIQYTGNDGIKEPLYKQLVKPHSTITFVPGEKGIPEIKWGFCLDQIYYVENPTQEQKNKNSEKAPWRKVEITWVEEKSKTKKKFAPKRIKITKVAVATPAEKSRCRDRHFDITRDEQGRIIITSSLAE